MAQKTEPNSDNIALLLEQAIKKSTQGMLKNFPIVQLNILGLIIPDEFLNMSEETLPTNLLPPP